MIRVEAQLSVSRFAELIGVPRRTYHYRLARWRAGDLEKGAWQAPVEGAGRTGRGKVCRGVGGVGGSEDRGDRQRRRLGRRVAVVGETGHGTAGPVADVG